LSSGLRRSASSANCRPLIEPGIITSVSRRSIAALASMMVSASLALPAASVR
jgi:hypothetical protein